jgi:heme oxygenase
MAKDRVAQTSLAGEINTATRYVHAAPPPRPLCIIVTVLTVTRALHAQLNKLITSRIPFAIPPLASDTRPYTAGLVHFSHIFLTFESLWNDLLPSPASPPTSPLLSFLLVNPYAEPELFTSPPSARTVEFLQNLRPRGLARSQRIKQDLQYLSGLHPTDLDVMLAQYPGDKVAEFCTHIRRSVGHKPHVLVAYAWCYYMAVFSGGRYIRAQLLKADTDFWKSGTDDGVPLTEKGLSLWFFPGEDDGDSIKKAFNERLLHAEDLFTPDERIDIIEEAKHIFKFSAQLVEELDEQLGTDLQQLERLKRPAPPSDDLKIHTITPKMSHASTWLQRPEVTGVAVALGCVVCAVLVRFSL